MILKGYYQIKVRYNRQNNECHILAYDMWECRMIFDDDIEASDGVYLLDTLEDYIVGIKENDPDATVLIEVEEYFED